MHKKKTFKHEENMLDWKEMFKKKTRKELPETQHA